MYLRAELYCYFCGHGSGEVIVATKSRRPTPEQLKAAYSAITGPRAPIWDAGEQPYALSAGAVGQLSHGASSWTELQTVRGRRPAR